MSKLIESLEPEVTDLCRAHLAACAREGILLKVTQGRRTLEAQRMLYAQGRTAPGPRVTNAPPGYSAHNFGLAYDVAEADKSPYDLGVPGPDDDDALWEKIGDLGEALGLEWGGRWKFVDKPHFQYLGGRTLAQLRTEAKERGELA